MLLSAGILAGCGPAERNPRPIALSTGEARLWKPTVSALPARSLLILCGPGSVPEYWNALAVAASREGFHVLITPPGITPEAGWAALEAEGLRDDHRVLLGDGPAGGLALRAAPNVPRLDAVIAFSLTRAETGADPLALLEPLHGMPLLLVACENDIEGAAVAHAVKDAAGGYCELQVYACGVRGADILAAAPNVSAQILAWLKPIVGEGPAAPTN